MENRVCKKCREPLPVGYRHQKCESCRNKTIQGIKNGGKVALSIVGVIGTTAVAIATKGKIDLNKK